jgi:hypothetical protein
MLTILPDAVCFNTEPLDTGLRQDGDANFGQNSLRLYVHLRTIATQAARQAVDNEIARLAVDPTALAHVLEAPARLTPEPQRTPR